MNYPRVPLGNGGNGIFIDTGCTGNLIGGAATGAGNVISANGQMFKITQMAGNGIDLVGSNNFVKNNIVGLDKNGADPNNDMANLLIWLDDESANGNVVLNNQHN